MNGPRYIASAACRAFCLALVAGAGWLIIAPGLPLLSGLFA
jgi:hypothetical protein